MSPQDSSTTSSSSSSSSCPMHLNPPDHQQMDNLLAGAGYVVRSSELGQVAQRLEHLENVMVNNPIMSMEIANDLVHYNPSDLGSWVDSLLNELHDNQPLLDFPAVPSDPSYVIVNSNFVSGPSATWTDKNQEPQQLTITTREQEDSGIRLVHVLMTCAASIQRGEFSLAGSLIDQLQALLTAMNTDSGIGKVAGYFVNALSRRLFAPQSACLINGSASENETLYYNFYEASPCLKFAHFTANQAILEAFQGHDCVHVIDFNLMHGLQWPALIQALALRRGGPPMLRLTGIGPPSSDGRDSLREIGLKLAELARSVNVRFAFRGVAATRLDDVKPWMLQVSSKEVVAVNSIMQLHKLLGQNPGSPIDSILDWMRSLNPKVVTIVEQEANHNQLEFLDRFTEALYYYSTMFDSLEACPAQPEKALA